MPPSIKIDSKYASHRREVSGALNAALENRRSYLGFLLGMAATLVIVLSALGWTIVQTGILQY